jgi:hypothetical protein
VFLRSASLFPSFCSSVLFLLSLLLAKYIKNR